MKKTFFIILFFLISIPLVSIGISQYNIMNPKYVPIPKYLNSWIHTPSKHNIKISKYETQGIPYLLVEYDVNGTMSKRSKKLRKQMSAYGYTHDELQNNGLLVMFHGKNMRKEHLLPVAERYTAVGFTCVLIDLPEHGDNKNPIQSYGQNNIESHYLTTVIKDLSSHRAKLSTQALYVWGISLGGAFAISNSIYVKPNALILISTFDKLSYILEEKSEYLFGQTLGKLLYTGLNYSLSFFYNFHPEEIDSTKHAKKLHVPIMVFHGKKDKLIHYSHGEKLFQSFPNKHKILILDTNGNHENILITKYPFYAQSVKFLLESTKKH